MNFTKKILTNQDAMQLHRPTKRIPEITASDLLEYSLIMKFGHSRLKGGGGACRVLDPISQHLSVTRPC